MILAGLGEADEMTLLGGLVVLARTLKADPERAASYRSLGVDLTERKRAEQNPTYQLCMVRFPLAPPIEVRDLLKSAGLSWEDDRTWRGVADFARVAKIAQKGGGHAERL